MRIHIISDMEGVSRIRETISCGAGRDTVIADRIDRISPDCEIVKRP